MGRIAKKSARGIGRFAGIALALAAALLAAQHAGCSCNGNGHVPHTPVVIRPGDNVVNCACNLTFDYHSCDNGVCFANFQIQLCLPPELRLSPDTDMGFTTADGGVESYAEKIDEYCRNDISNAAYHLIKVFNGNWCEYKSPFAPDGGVGQSVQCFAHELTPGKEDATRLDPSCPAVCPAVDCQYALNCGDGVQDVEGNIHLDRCQCNQVSGYYCPGDPPSDLPTVVFCRPADPAAPQ